MIDLSFSKSEKEYENMLPLINVVFLLLIFFLLAGSFTTPEVFFVEPPTASIEQIADVRDDVILINQDGKIGYLGGIIQESELREHITKVEHEALKIKADATTKATRVIAVIDLLQEAGIKNIELLTVAE